MKSTWAGKWKAILLSVVRNQRRKMQEIRGRKLTEHGVHYVCSHTRYHRKLPDDKHAEALVWHLTQNIWTRSSVVFLPEEMAFFPSRTAPSSDLFLPFRAAELYLADARLFFLCWVLDPDLILVSAMLVYKRLQPPSCSAQGAVFQGAEAEAFWGELPWQYPCCFNATHTGLQVRCARTTTEKESYRFYRGCDGYFGICCGTWATTNVQF